MSIADAPSEEGVVKKQVSISPNSTSDQFNLHVKVGDLKGTSNPISLEPNPDEPRIFWGDLHAHTNLAQGLESPDFIYHWAREIEGLDFMAHVEHDAAGDIDIWVGEEFREYRKGMTDIREYIHETWELRQNLTAVEIVKNGSPFYRYLGKDELDRVIKLTIPDRAPTSEAGDFYYLRVGQADGSMAWEIRTYEETLVEELITVFNQEMEEDKFVVPLTPAIFTSQISSKPTFSSQGCFLAVEDGHAVGFALTSPGVDPKHGGRADPTIGVVDGLFFPQDRLGIGDALLAQCMEHFEQRGNMETVYGFASFGGYPYWRGLYCGAEPVCLTRYTHAWVAFMARGFTHHQQSINYLGTTEPRAYRDNLDYEVSDLDISSEWAEQSWKGHIPKVITAKKNGAFRGRIGYVELPYLSEYRQKNMGAIYSMNVHPEYRRQGTGTALIDHLFNHACASGVEEILVGTTVENTSARRTYEKGGMKPIAFRTGTGDPVIRSSNPSLPGVFASNWTICHPVPVTCTSSSLNLKYRAMLSPVPSLHRVRCQVLSRTVCRTRIWTTFSIGHR